MDNAAYVALSRQMTLRRELDITANNIANMNTTGFKLESLEIHTETARPARNDQIRGPVNFVLDHQVNRDFRPGNLKQTGNPLDLALDGEGAFFEVETPQGPRYTRAGSFTVSPTGVLVTAQGHPVKGEGGTEITLNPQLGEPTVSADGIVSQQGQRLGRIGVQRFANLSVLTKDGDTLFTNPTNIQPVAANDARIRQGFLEESNVNPVVEITKLIEINRAYESLAKIISNTEDLSRRSVERLGRVN